MGESDFIAETDYFDKLSFLIGQKKAQTKYRALNINAKLTMDQRKVLERVFDLIQQEYDIKEAEKFINTIARKFWEDAAQDGKSEIAIKVEWQITGRTERIPKLRTIQVFIFSPKGGNPHNQHERKAIKIQKFKRIVAVNMLENMMPEPDR